MGVPTPDGWTRIGVDLYSRYVDGVGRYAIKRVSAGITGYRVFFRSMGTSYYGTVAQCADAVQRYLNSRDIRS